MDMQRKKITIFIILLFAVIAVTALTSAKYLYNSVWNYYVKSKGFYFTSDSLDINTKKNALLKWDGSDIYFEIKNSLNTELISEYDISYKVTCEVLGDESNDTICVLNGTNSSVFNGSLSSTAFCVNSKDAEDVSSFSKTECEINGYTWKEEVASKNNYFNFILTDPTKNIDELSVRITAESLTPYHQTLTGIFNINKVDVEETEFVTNYQSFSDYDELSITNKTTSNKCFLIGFSAESYLFDFEENSVLDYVVDANDKINEIKIQVGAQNSAFYKFYKINMQKEYSINDFIIEEKEC